MRLGGTTLASVKNESVAKCGRIYYGMFFLSSGCGK